MSGGVNVRTCGEHRHPACRGGACLPRSRRVQLGVGMLEFLLALLIFSVGMLGLLSAQLAGKRAVFEAGQRSTATALARDILERIRANPGQLDAYDLAVAGDASARLPTPGADCDVAVCTSEQLAAFDLWQWESLLLGEPEQAEGESTGGLVAPRGCIRRDGGEVTVTISWLAGAPDGSAVASGCDVEGDAPASPQDAGIEATRRHHLAVATFIAG
jgi:type IV pilus assembly protein PilV